jgi:molybdopterin converting factor small subunit
MATVWVPSLMRDLTDGRQTVDVPGETVGQVVAALDRLYPGIAARLCQGERLIPEVTAYVDGQVAPLGMGQRVGAESEVRFLPAMGGG